MCEEHPVPCDYCQKKLSARKHVSFALFFCLLFFLIRNSRSFYSSANIWSKTVKNISCNAPSLAANSRFVYIGAMLECTT